MDAKKRRMEFILGLVLMVGFLVVLGGVFSPFFDGKNGMEFMDSLYNSISKGSANYIREMKEAAASLRGQSIEAVITFGTDTQTERIADLFNKNGGEAAVSGNEIVFSGDLGVIFRGALNDAESMYRNDAEAVTTRYGFEAKAVLYNWWAAANAIDKRLTQEKRFETAKTVATIKGKAIETAYNYYGIEPRHIGDEVFLVIGSLVFYIVYTLWYGFAILFMSEGLGFRLEH